MNYENVRLEGITGDQIVRIDTWEVEDDDCHEADGEER